MDVYMILKVASEQEKQSYHYLYSKYSINIIIWKPGKSDHYNAVIDKLFERVGTPKQWKLFVVDVSAVYPGENPFLCKQSDELVHFLQSPCFINGKGICRPPEKIYVFRRRKERVLSGNTGEFLQGIHEAVPICRFLFMDCSEKNYLKEWEDLELASAIILLGMNEIPAEIMEAYQVYKIQISVDENKLRDFLAYSEEKLEREGLELEIKYDQAESYTKQDVYSYRDYVPKLSVNSFKNLRIRHKFWGISKQDDGSEWMKEKVEIASRIDTVKKEQVYNQEALNREMKSRISLLETEDIFLKEEEKKEIQEKVLGIQRELNDSYIAFWEMDDELSREKSVKEKELDKILDNRYSIKEILKVLAAITTLLFIPFLFLFIGELGIRIGIKALDISEGRDMFLKGALFMIGRGLIFEVFFFGCWLFLSTVDVYKAIHAFNKVLDRINKNIKKNLVRYKKFFSLVYSLKVCQNFLVRSNSFVEQKKKRISDLKNKKECINIEKKSFENFKRKFEYLLEKENDFDLRKDRRIIEGADKQVLKLNGNNKEICNPLYFVSGISITKGVNDES